MDNTVMQWLISFSKLHISHKALKEKKQKGGKMCSATENLLFKKMDAAFTKTFIQTLQSCFISSFRLN